MAVKTTAKSTVISWGFRGMNNLETPPANLPDTTKKFTPRLIVNADVMDSGSLLSRTGYVSHISLPGAHSLWAETAMFVVADEILYRVEGKTLTPLTAVGTRSPMNYTEVNDQVFMSSAYWSGIFDLLAGEVRTWGVPLPGAPEIALVEGDLPPGRYSLAYSRVTYDGRLSGNGPLIRVEFEGRSRGIQLTNLETGLVPWITQPDGGKLFLPAVNDQNQITEQAPSIQPLITQGVQPPPLFDHFYYAHGRIWGIKGRKLYYSEPGQFEWFRRDGFLPFLEDLVMVAPFTGGLFVSSLTSTWCLDSTDPAKMTKKRVGDGAVPGTLTYAPVPAGIAGGAATSQIFANLSKMPTPVWLSPSGVVIGTHGGNLTNITSSRLHLAVRQKGAALTRTVMGLPQVVITQAGLAESVEELQEVFTRNGKLFD